MYLVCCVVRGLIRYCIGNPCLSCSVTCVPAAPPVQLPLYSSPCAVTAHCSDFVLFVQALRQIRESDGDATLVVETPTKGGGKGSSVSVTVTLCTIRYFLRKRTGKPPF